MPLTCLDVFRAVVPRFVPPMQLSHPGAATGGGWKYTLYIHRTTSPRDVVDQEWSDTGDLIPTNK